MIQDASGDWFLSDTYTSLDAGDTSIDLITTTWRTIDDPVTGSALVLTGTGTPDLSSVTGGGIHFWGISSVDAMFDSLTWTDEIMIEATMSPADGAFPVSIDPNSLKWAVDGGVTSIVRFGTVPDMTDPLDPNNTEYDVGTATEVPYATLEYNTTYYWQVTTDDSGAIEVSKTFSFTTESAIPVIEEFDNVRTSLDLLPADLAALITDNDDNLTGVTWELLADAAWSPAGATASVTPTVAPAPYDTPLDVVQRQL